MTSNGIDHSEEFSLSRELLPEDLTNVWDIGNEQNWLKRGKHQDPDSLADLDEFFSKSPSRPSSSDDSFKSATENPFSESGEKTSSYCHMDRRFTFVIDSPSFPIVANLSKISEQTFIENVSPPTPYYKSYEVSFSKTPSPEIYLNESNRSSSRRNLTTNIRKTTLQLFESSLDSTDISDKRLSIKIDTKPSLTSDYAVGSNLPISPHSKDLSNPVLARLPINKSCNNELPLDSHTMGCANNSHLREESHATIRDIPADLNNYILMTESASNIDKDALNGVNGNATEVTGSIGEISLNHTELNKCSDDTFEVSGMDDTLSSDTLVLENSTLRFGSSCCEKTLVAKNESERSPELNAPNNVEQIECNGSANAQCYSFIQSLQQVSETDLTSMKSDPVVDTREKLNHTIEEANTTFVDEDYSCCDETLVAQNEDDLSFGRDDVSSSCAELILAQCSSSKSRKTYQAVDPSTWPNADRSSEMGQVQQHTREQFNAGNGHTTCVSPGLSKVPKSPKTYQRHDSMMSLDSNSNIRPKIALSPPSCDTKKRNELGCQPATSDRRRSELLPANSVPDFIAAPVAETDGLSKTSPFSLSLANLSTLRNPASKRLSRIPLPTRAQ